MAMKPNNDQQTTRRELSGQERPPLRSQARPGATWEDSSTGHGATTVGSKDASGETSDAEEKKTRSPFWIWVSFGYGAFYHVLQFLFAISPNERPILTGEEPVRATAEEEGKSFAEVIASSGITIPEWFLNGIAITAGLSIFFLIAGMFFRRWGLSGYIVATLVMIGLTIKAGLFSPVWLVFPTFVTVIGVMNRDQLK
jgi:hypothetical protein